MVSVMFITELPVGSVRRLDLHGTFAAGAEIIQMNAAAV
jgi:hypothetical protein